MQEQKNLFLAIFLFLAFSLGWHFWYVKPREEELQRQLALSQQTQQTQTQSHIQSTEVKGATSATLIDSDIAVNRLELLGKTPRVKIKTAKISGSINLVGAVIDDLVLSSYFETTQPNSDSIVLLAPKGSHHPYYAELNWISDHAEIKMPTADTVWQASSEQLSPGHPVTLSWKNSDGILFERTIAIDEDYLFTITDKVTNGSKISLKMKQQSHIDRIGTPETGKFFILHEGPIGIINGKLTEITYDTLQEKKSIEEPTKAGWVGITDKYWLVALLPEQKSLASTRFSEQTVGRKNLYQSSVSTETWDVQPNQSILVKQYLFAGAKILSLLDRYEIEVGIDRLDLAIDFGWFYFLTKPLFYALEYLNKILGNLGIAILVITVAFKGVLFPLANKSYRSMAKMKALQPKMEVLKARYGNDKMKLNQELMLMYQKEKVNPLSGCLPMLIQAPLLFCLYKVLFVTLEMRHAPFLGWIHDLSAPDPTTIFNLFGLIPWSPPSFLMIGAWPILMGVTMWLQQRLNPQPTDPAQAKAFMIMPFLLTFMLASFPAGLVIYWAWNNILSMGQQWLIMTLEAGKALSASRPSIQSNGKKSR